MCGPGIALLQFEKLTHDGLLAELQALRQHPTTYLEFSWAEGVPIDRLSDLLPSYRGFTYRDALLIESASQLEESQRWSLADSLRFVADRAAVELYKHFHVIGARDGFEFLSDPGFLGGVEVGALDSAMERAVINYEHEKDFWIASITHRLMGTSHPLPRVGDILLRAEYSGSLRSVFASIESMTLAMNSCISSVVLCNISTAARCIHQRASQFGIEIVDGLLGSKRLTVNNDG